jgi:CubicO group peptidase (beta-lactamase class C family)
MKRTISVALVLSAVGFLEHRGAATVQSRDGRPTLTDGGAADLTAFFQSAVSRGDVPGVVALVVNRDRVVYHEAFGSLNDAKHIAMSNDAIFNIASMTKPVTSVAVMQLVEAGQLRLEDQASKYLPSIANLEVLASVDKAAGTYETRPARTPITIHHLLTNTSGIGYAFSDPGLALVQAKTRRPDGELPLVHDPGVRWTYGASTRVLGDIVAKISGQPLDQYLEARVFKPLGMRDTAYMVPPEKEVRAVTIHTRVDGRWAEQPRTGPLPAAVRGDGGLYSTAADYGRFVRMLLNGGTLDGARIVSERTVSEMTRNQIGRLVVPLQPSANLATAKPFPLGAGHDTWGLGFLLETRAEPNTRSVGSYSWAGIYNTEFWVDPHQQIGAVLLMQALPFYDDNAIALLHGFEERIYRSLDGRRPS